MKLKKILISIILLGSFCCCNEKIDFVEVRDGSFLIDNLEYLYMGANYWQGMNLGAPESGDRERLCRELDQMKKAGITNLRVLAASEAGENSKYCIKPALQTAPGEYNNDIWLGLDYLLEQMGKRDMKAVMVLGNFWTWSGGFSQYLEWNGAGIIPYPQDPTFSWGEYCEYTKMFLKDEVAMGWMNNHIRKVVGRVNSITGTEYKNDPTIMSWQLANEPRGHSLKSEFKDWIISTSDLIRELDSNHLISIGSEGNTPSLDPGLDVYEDHNYKNIDYVTMHIWAQNWNWFTPGDSEEAYQEMIVKVDSYIADHIAAAEKLNKPLVLEEFGLARDGVSYETTSSTVCKDRYYGDIFSRVSESALSGLPIKGVNFWAYSGDGVPPRPGEYWKVGDSFVGDPPHELQGWYGVYATDRSTLSVIKRFSDILNKIE